VVEFTGRKNDCGVTSDHVAGICWHCGARVGNALWCGLCHGDLRTPAALPAPVTPPERVAPATSQGQQASIDALFDQLAHHYPDPLHGLSSLLGSGQRRAMAAGLGVAGVSVVSSFVLWLFGHFL
jgi:hypothetical protein